MKKPVSAVNIVELLPQLEGMGWYVATATLKHTVANGYTGLITPDNLKAPPPDKDFADRNFQNQHAYTKEQFEAMKTSIFDLNKL